ncbi:GNAT family N-acetyltransferase [Paenisporosarcina quisquiliarum]|uniref:GNAT family N-acetyltransferase n=1 Tax=Paenisporosarcina quisquiliarum TaxID=365346 RepID=A0A9X3LHE2_9BACL|nr:N-acetyltransferase [Paenisporosarcina quisquiliarum]MCZ8537998.1 GNAT family N-acetyltransferase [Paenisporosarcina quisquiliarum]
MIELKYSKDLEAVSRFIANMNKITQHHVGYCGINEKEILHTLLNDFSDFPLEESLVVAYENDTMIGVLGFDIDGNTRNAEIWGPFVNHDEWQQVSIMMWDQLVRQLPLSLNNAHGFYQIHNSNCTSFMKRLGATNKGEHLILTITRSHLQPSIEAKCEVAEMTSDEYDSFKLLHEEAFKHAYFTAEEIIEKINNGHKVFVASSEGKLLGYVFCEANPNFSEGDIHFIAVTPHARNRGIGKQLLNESLKFLFSFHEINEITLCVKRSNEAAISIYKKVGFEEEHQLVTYELTI